VSSLGTSSCTEDESLRTSSCTEDESLRTSSCTEDQSLPSFYRLYINELENLLY
jgi:hypothetical protein